MQSNDANSLWQLIDVQSRQMNYMTAAAVCVHCVHVGKCYDAKLL